MTKDITTTKRLYDTDPRDGRRFLAYPVGASVPPAEYERLTSKTKKAASANTPKPAEASKVPDQPAPAAPQGDPAPAAPADSTPAEAPKPAEATKSLSKMNREDLGAIVTAEGVDIGDADTNAKIVAAIKAHREAKATKE